MFRPSWSQRALHRVFRHRGARQLARIFTRPAQQQRWLFVIGCYNSGTTLLHGLLARHPDVTSLPGEGAFLTDLLHTPEDFGSTRMIPPIESELMHCDAIANSAIIRKDWGIFLDPAKPVALEKSVSHLTRLPWLLERFPGAQFIHLVRDGRAVVEGLRRHTTTQERGPVAPNGEYTLEQCAAQWTYALDKVEDFEHQAGADRLLTIRYEDLCRHPHRTWSAITRFSRLTAVNLPELSIVDQNPEAWARLSSDDRNQLKTLLQTHMRRFGYHRAVAL